MDGMNEIDIASIPVTTEVTPSSPPEERTFRQSELNDIVKRAKHEAVEGYRRINTQQPEYAQQKYGQTPTPSNAYSQPPQGFAESDVRRLAAEEAQRLRNEWVSEAQSKSEAEQAQKIVSNFWNKINSGKEKYQDFDQVTGDIQFSSFPNVVQLLSEHIENSGDVLYELGKNRMKMSQLEQLSYMSPKDAIVEVKRLAQSIKDNETASTTRYSNQPLSQQRPSNVGTEAGALSMKDLKSKYRG